MSSDDTGGFDISSDKQDTVALGGDDHSTIVLNNNSKIRSESNYSKSDQYLRVEIPESKNEHDKVLFLIHTKANLPNYAAESKVWRQYEDFLWLHDNLLNSSHYSGLIIPPAPPKPDFSNSRLKLRNLSSLETSITENELNKLKDELQVEYISSFKKTVVMHENFLKRLAKHPKIRNDQNFTIFLEFDGDLLVRTQNTKEKAVAIFKNLTKSMDEALILSNQVDNDQFFRDVKYNLVNYDKRLKESVSYANQVHKNRIDLSQNMLQTQIAFSDIINVSSGLSKIQPNQSEFKLVEAFSNFFDKAQKLESSFAADEDWKLWDTLKYYQRETNAAKLVLYQRSKLLAEYESSTKALDRARERRKDFALAEAVNKLSYEKFEKISVLAKEEITTYLNDRVKYFNENLLSLTKLQTENTKKYATFVKEMINEIKNIEYSQPSSSSMLNGQNSAE